jgi:hypothetical protein
MIDTAHTKQVAGGCETTTATTNDAIKIIAIFTQRKVIFLRFAAWLAVMTKGIA